MVARGSVTGVDLSEEMCAYATKMFPASYYKNLVFLPTKEVDFGDLRLSKKFDIVTSFCVFHLVPHPTKVLQNIKPYMHAKSKLILTLPIGGNLEFFQAASEEMAKRGWSFPAPTEGTKAMRDPSKIQQIFKDVGLKIEQLSRD